MLSGEPPGLAIAAIQYRSAQVRELPQDTDGWILVLNGYKLDQVSLYLPVKHWPGQSNPASQTNQTCQIHVTDGPIFVAPYLSIPPADDALLSRQTSLTRIASDGSPLNEIARPPSFPQRIPTLREGQIQNMIKIKALRQWSIAKTKGHDTRGSSSIL